MSLLLDRKSIRKFTDKIISEEDITKLLTAAMQAPSACNQQPWEFIVVDDKALLVELSKASRGAWMLADVNKAIIVIMTETEPSPRMRQQDCGAATENILLEATNLGIGSVWIGVYPLEERLEYVNKLLNITNGNAFSMIALGYPNETRDVPLRYDKSRVYRNKVK